VECTAKLEFFSKCLRFARGMLMVCIPRNVIEAENVVLLGLTCILSDYLHTARDERLGKDDGAVAE
jgi:hypothetical protein